MTSREEVEKAMQEVQRLARMIYALIPAGCTIDLTWPNESGIITLGKPPKLDRLIITRPMLHVDLSQRPSIPMPDPKNGGAHD